MIRNTIKFHIIEKIRTVVYKNISDGTDNYIFDKEEFTALINMKKAYEARFGKTTQQRIFGEIAQKCFVSLSVNIKINTAIAISSKNTASPIAAAKVSVITPVTDIPAKAIKTVGEMMQSETARAVQGAYSEQLCHLKYSVKIRS